MTAADEATHVGPPPTSPGRVAVFLARVRRVFSFDTSVYEEVAAGPATLQAVFVIAVAAVNSGGMVTAVLFFLVVPLSLIATGIFALLVTIAARLFGSHSASLGEWYRALGFAQAPLMVGAVPFVGSFAFVYLVAAAVAAISRVARLPIGSAILTFLVACLPAYLLLVGMAVVFQELLQVLVTW